MPAAGLPPRSKRPLREGRCEVSQPMEAQMSDLKTKARNKLPARNFAERPLNPAPRDAAGPWRGKVSFDEGQLQPAAAPLLQLLARTTTWMSGAKASAARAKASMQHGRFAALFRAGMAIAIRRTMPSPRK